MPISSFLGTMFSLEFRFNPLRNGHIPSCLQGPVLEGHQPNPNLRCPASGVRTQIVLRTAFGKHNAMVLAQHEVCVLLQLELFLGLFHMETRPMFAGFAILRRNPACVVQGEPHLPSFRCPKLIDVLVPCSVKAPQAIPEFQWVLSAGNITG